MINERWKVRSWTEKNGGKITECVHSLDECITAAARHRAAGWVNQIAWREERIEGKGFTKVEDVELNTEDL